MYKFNGIDKITFILVILGAINWGLLGLFNCNLVGILFGEPATILSRIVYILIGVSGVYMITLILKIRKCSKS